MNIGGRGGEGRRGGEGVKEIEGYKCRREGRDMGVGRGGEE